MIVMNVRRGLPVAAVLVALALVASATGCTSRSAAADTRLQVVAGYYPPQVVAPPALFRPAPGSPSRSAAADTRLQVVAAYYPLQFAASEIGGVDVSVSSLTRPGGEPHDLEITPRDVVVMQKAALVA